MAGLTYIENEQLLHSGSFYTASGNITISPLAAELGSTITIGIVGGYALPTLAQIALIGSQSISASYVPNLYPQTYQVSGSWASASLSSSYVPNLYPQVTQGTVASASWVSASVFITTAQTASYVTASNVIGVVSSASYVPNLYPQVAQITVPSSSWVSASAFIITAQSASYIDAGNITTGILNNTRLPSQINVTGVSASFTGSLKGNLNGTASYAPTQLPDITDDTINHRIGINNVIPYSALDVVGNISLNGYLVNSNITSSNSNFIGVGAGGVTGANNSNFFGINAGWSATSAANSNFFGINAGWDAIGGNDSNFFGYYAGNGAYYAANSNFFGRTAGYNAQYANASNFFGYQAGASATNANNSIFIGYNSGLSDTVNNSAGNSSILIGDYTSTGGNSDSICIGKGTMNNAAKQLNVGNVLYATGIYSGSTPSSTPIAGAKVGIGKNNPVNTLDVIGNISCSVITASLFNGTASWSNNSITASYVSNLYPQVSQVTVPSASWVSASAFITTAQTASYINADGITTGTLNNARLPSQINVTGISASFTGSFKGNFNGTASWSNNSVTASSADSFHVRGDVTIDGALFASQLSASNIYITSSNLVVFDNILQLNAQTPHLRYAGIELFDSGSSNQAAFFLWDGLNNYFFVSSSDAGWSRKIVMGPINETDLTPNYVPIADNFNSLKDSVIYQSASNVIIGATISVNKLDVAGNISCSVITASLNGTASYAQTASYVLSSNIVGYITALSASWASSSISSSYLKAGDNIITDIVAVFNTVDIYGELSAGSNFRITEDGDIRITENGDLRIIESVAPFTVDINGNVASDGWIFSYGGFTGSLFGTSSWSNNSVTASYVSSSVIVGIVTSASYAITSSWSNNSPIQLPDITDVSGEVFINNAAHGGTTLAGANVNIFSPGGFIDINTGGVGGISIDGLGNTTIQNAYITGSMTGNVIGSASYALTASYVSSSNIVGTVSSASYYTAQNYACRKTPTGLINGANAVFTWSPIPIPGTETLTRNGIIQDDSGNDYTISGGGVTFVSAPLTGDKIKMSYYF